MVNPVFAPITTSFATPQVDLSGLGDVIGAGIQQYQAKGALDQLMQAKTPQEQQSAIYRLFSVSPALGEHAAEMVKEMRGPQLTPDALLAYYGGEQTRSINAAKAVISSYSKDKRDFFDEFPDKAPADYRQALDTLKSGGGGGGMPALMGAGGAAPAPTMRQPMSYAPPQGAETPEALSQQYPAVPGAMQPIQRDPRGAYFPDQGAAAPPQTTPLANKPAQAAAEQPAQTEPGYEQWLQSRLVAKEKATQQAKIEAKKPTFDEAKDKADMIAGGLEATSRTVDQLLALPDAVGSSAFGMGASIPILGGLGGTNQADARAALEGLKGQIGLQRFQQMRELSKTGSAGMQRLTNYELQILSNSLASLNEKQSWPRIKQNLQFIKAMTERAKGHLTGVLERDYPGQKPKVEPKSINAGGVVDYKDFFQ